MTTRIARVSVVLLAAALATSCTREVQLRMALDVVSQPDKAQVKFKGKAIGETPTSVEVKTYSELESIVAEKPGLDVVEKRIRILSPEKAELIFRLGKGEVSKVAQELKLSRILIFDYSEKVSFDTDKFDLKPEALPVLNTQAEILQTYCPAAQVHVCGYTDATGSDEHNLKLSLQRATAVADYLIARGVAKTRIITHGFGKDFPADTNATPQGRALNRRTEVILPQ